MTAPSSTSVTRDFHIGDILSVTDGHLVSPRHIGGVYDILNWMTGESLMTHQLPRASRECEDNLRRQHPDLATVQVPEGLGTEANVLAWLAEQVGVYGETRPVAPLPAGDHTHIDPLTELSMMRPDLPVIPVVHLFVAEDGGGSAVNAPSPSSVLDDLAQCAVPGCGGVVAAWGVVCPDCKAAFGEFLVVAPVSAPVTREQLEERDATTAAAYAKQKELVPERKRNQRCWICEERRTCSWVKGPTTSFDWECDECRDLT